jgi:hypothetical protein
VVEELFLNYFSQEKFIGDRAVLLAAAEKVFFYNQIVIFMIYSICNILHIIHILLIHIY